MHNLGFVVNANYFIDQIKQLSGNLKRAIPVFVEFKTFRGLFGGVIEVDCHLFESSLILLSCHTTVCSSDGTSCSLSSLTYMQVLN